MLRAFFLLTFSALLIFPAHADGEGNGEDSHKGKLEERELYKARKQGALMPLDEILENLDEYGIRQVLEIEVDFDDGRVIYEIYFLDMKGRRMEVEVDASTGEVIDFEEDD